MWISRKRFEKLEELEEAVRDLQEWHWSMRHKLIALGWELGYVYRERESIREGWVKKGGKDA